MRRDYQAHRHDSRGRTRELHGIVRENGQVATRTTSACWPPSNVRRRSLTDRRVFHAGAAGGYPNIDGVAAFAHGHRMRHGNDGRAMDLLRRTMAGLCAPRQPRRRLVVGPGLRTQQIKGLFKEQGLAVNSRLRTS